MCDHEAHEKNETGGEECERRDRRGSQRHAEKNVIDGFIYTTKPPKETGQEDSCLATCIQCEVICFRTEARRVRRTQTIKDLSVPFRKVIPFHTAARRAQRRTNEFFAPSRLCVRSFYFMRRPTRPTCPTGPTRLTTTSATHTKAANTMPQWSGTVS